MKTRKVLPEDLDEFVLVDANDMSMYYKATNEEAGEGLSVLETSEGLEDAVIYSEHDATQIMNNDPENIAIMSLKTAMERHGEEIEIEELN